MEGPFLLEYMEREGYEIVAAVDHGLEFFYENHLIPDYVIGDFDSVQKPVLEFFRKISVDGEQRPKERIDVAQKSKERIDGGQRPEASLEQKPEENAGQNLEESVGQKPKFIGLNPVKDDTDTEHALRLLLELGCKTVHMFGCTGSRLDHVLGNIQLLGYGLRAGAECEILDAHNRIRLIRQETLLKRQEQFGTYVSLIPYTPQVTGLTLEGFAYPLKDFTMSCFYREDAAPVSGISNEITGEQARISWKEGILVLVESRD